MRKPTGHSKVRRPTLAQARRLAARRFGISRLHDDQELVLERVLAGRSLLAVMPTGAGKSLTYQLPALLLPGTTVVVSPLIALMKDQADKLQSLGVDIAVVNSTLARSEERAALQGIAQARHEIVFATPERLADPAFVQTLKSQPIDLMVVDEAHCISQWGHDFRPAFLEIGAARRTLGSPPLLALTATATEEVVGDIVRELGLRRDDVINTGIYRPNLHLGVRQLTNEGQRWTEVLDAVRSQRGPGIVYTATVRAAEELHGKLQEAGEQAALYHGRLRARQRQEQQDAFMRGDLRVMVATNAFGMGIDKRDLRFVAHYQMPATLEAYVQEAGRAGRDGAPARCVLLFFRKDRALQQFFLAGKYPDADEVMRIYTALPSEGGGLAPASLAERSGVARNKLQVVLKWLRDAGLARQSRARAWMQTAGTGDPARLADLAHAYRTRGDQDRASLQRVIDYAYGGGCRWAFLLQHFGEPSAGPCGHCDNCQQPVYPDPPASDEAVESTAPEPAAKPAFQPGERVRVLLGEGRVRQATADEVTIDLDDGDTRSFVADKVCRA